MGASTENGKDPTLLHDLHAINQEISRKGLWERGEPGVGIADLKPASGAGAATPIAPLPDWLCRSDDATQEAIKPAASLTPPSAAMATPSSWAYRHPADYNIHTSPCCPDSTEDQVAEAVNEVGQLPPVVVLRHNEMPTDTNVTPVATAPPIVSEPSGEPTSRTETALGSSLALPAGNEANETTNSAGVETASERQATSAEHVLLSGEEEGSVSLGARKPWCATAKAALNATPKYGQDSLFDDARASAPPPQQRNLILADSIEDECSRHERSLDGFARTVSEQFLEGLDDLDFANLDLTPAAQSKTNTSLQRASASPTSSRAFQRTRSRKGRTDSFDDLAEDNGFWDEVFDGEMRPLDTMAALEADEWTDLEALSDIEASATAAFVPPPMPCSPPPGAHLGFSTAANKRLAQPSEADVARVMKRLGQPSGTEEMPEEDVESMGAALAARREAQPVSLPAKRPPQVSAATHQEYGHTALNQWKEDQVCHEGAPAESQLIPATVSFKRANGLSLELNTAALEAAKRKMARWEAEHCQEKGKTPKLAAGVPINPNVIRGPTKPSDGGIASVVPEVEPALTKASSSAHPCRETAGGTPGQGESIRSGATLPKASYNDAASVDASPDDLPLTPSEIMQADSQADGQVSTPVRHVTARFNGSLGTAGKEASTPDRRIFTRLDGRTSRISLGMTPRANFTPKTAGRPTFKTPFKHGVAAARPSNMFGSGSPTAALVQSRTYPHDLRTSPKKGAAGALDPTRRDPSVFELKAIVPRLSLKEYRMLPYVPRRVPAEEVPHEVMTIIKEPRMSFCWVFDSPTGEDRGVKTALEELNRAGASRVDLAWVKNHWTMILWKLAYYTRCKPQEAAIWWCFEQVMRQLRYRYEREINFAQRSAIKRIQERDSSPSLPMILRVFGHQRINAEDVGRPGEHGKFEDSVSGCYDYELELTDGWYWMRARMDRTLSRAFKRGRIPLGMKLAIQGAKLESNSTDGNDVLGASGISRLVLSGNGTSPAPWDSRMGFQKHAFSASLRSLTADGGLIPSMEVTITRLFPIAYVESNGTSMQQMGSARGAAEEADAQRAWEARRDDSRSRLEGKIEHDLKHIDEVQELLSASVGQDSGSTDQSEEEEDDGSQSDSAFALDYDLLADNTLDDLLSSDTPSSTLASRLRSLPTTRQRRFLCRLSYLAAVRSDHMRRAARAGLELELNGLCPVRKVRSFRVCRFIDAREAKRKGPSKRTVQLTVWDLGDLDQGTLEEGATYKVTNLIPTQRSSWRSCNVEADAFLATRRDSTWKRLR
jgi:breast cancer 2 susceptibility protein